MVAPGQITQGIVRGGRLILENLPFGDGQRVQVIILRGSDVQPDRAEAKRLLRGSVVRYDDPFGPAAPPEDWEALR